MVDLSNYPACLVPTPPPARFPSAANLQEVLQVFGIPEGSWESVEEQGTCIPWLITRFVLHLTPAFSLIGSEDQRATHGGLGYTHRGDPGGTLHTNRLDPFWFLALP